MLLQISIFGKFYSVKHLIALLLVVSAIACNSKKSSRDEPRDGGGCSYRYDTIPARVVKIERQATQQPRVLFVLLRNAASTDTIPYFMANGKDLSEEEIKEKGVVEGAVFQFITGEIKSGSCNPSLKRIVLNKYEGKLPAARDTVPF